MSRRKRWTEEEDRVILSRVRENLKNMSKAFEAAAQDLGRTKLAVSNRWYSHISKQKGSTAFILLSEKAAFNNRKNISKNTPELKVKLPLWKRILKVLGL